MKNTRNYLAQDGAPKSHFGFHLVVVIELLQEAEMETSQQYRREKTLATDKNPQLP